MQHTYVPADAWLVVWADVVGVAGLLARALSALVMKRARPSAARADALAVLLGSFLRSA